MRIALISPVALGHRPSAPDAPWVAPVPDPPLDRPYGSALVGPITAPTPARHVPTSYDAADGMGGRSRHSSNGSEGDDAPAADTGDESAAVPDATPGGPLGDHSSWERLLEALTRARSVARGGVP